MEQNGALAAIEDCVNEYQIKKKRQLKARYSIKHMSRKKFTKLLMSVGMPRKTAKTVCKFVILYGSYIELAKKLQFVYEYTEHGPKYKNCLIET